jgi:nucleoside-diphosphate-sugar epimerase
VKTALITGITGQDGSFLAEFLLEKGYVVHGIIRRASSFNTGRIDKVYVDSHDRNAKLFLHYGDLTDGGAIRRLIDRIQPDEIYNLAAQSHVRVSFGEPEFTADAVALGTLRILAALRNEVDNSGKPIRFYQAGSSEMFGAAGPPRREFSHVDDFASAALHLMRHYDESEIINVGAGEDLTIAELAELIRHVVGYTGRIALDAGKLDATPRKLPDISKLHASGWRARIGIEAGIRKTYQWYLAHEMLAANP